MPYQTAQRPKRSLLYAAYAALAVWGATEWLSSGPEAGRILNPLVFLAYFGSVTACLILAVLLFLFRPARGRLSEARIVACLLLVPLLWNLIQPALAA